MRKSLFILQKRNVLYLRLLIALGTTFSPWILILWVYGQFGMLLNRMSRTYSKLSQERYFQFGILIFLSSQEVLARAAGTTPFIPHEFSKYAITLFLLYVGTRNYYGRTSTTGMYLVALFFPPLLVAFLAEKLNMAGFVNSALGLINIGLGVWVFNGKRISQSNLIFFLRLLLFAALMLLVFVFIRTPDYDDIKFDFGANAAASGGFGSNQVSTVLGLGMFICGVSYIKGYRLSGYVWLDGILFFVFLFQGLLTLSRGGIMVGAISLIVFVTRQFSSLGARMKARIFVGFFLIVVGTFLVFTIADSITGGVLSLRYQGETAGTLSGAKERSLNTLTTGRYNIMIEDLNLWLQSVPSFMFGVGLGVSQEIRGGGFQGVAAHVELSRLLAEQGILGIIIFIYLFSIGGRLLKGRSDFRDLQIALFVLAILTTFHAAMRTFVTPVLMILCLFSEAHLPEMQKPEKK